mmetsp:Transcript_82007/g.196606  ORF Transcript_82007/g.196606 Transcript_82007/m.196606 type:complete len:275 (-) Transcript_82007:4595-5419(-)
MVMVGTHFRGAGPSILAPHAHFEGRDIQGRLCEVIIRLLDSDGSFASLRLAAREGESFSGLGAAVDHPKSHKSCGTIGRDLEGSEVPVLLVHCVAGFLRAIGRLTGGLVATLQRVGFSVEDARDNLPGHASLQTCGRHSESWLLKGRLLHHIVLFGLCSGCNALHRPAARNAVGRQWLRAGADDRLPDIVWGTGHLHIEVRHQEVLLMHDVALLHTQGGGVALQETTLHLEGLEVVGASSHLPLRDFPVGTVLAPWHNTEEGPLEGLHLQVISL